MRSKQHFAIQKRNEEKILKLCQNATERTGIYTFTREENGFLFAYVGQAKNLLKRLASHLSGYEQHIDCSIKKHGLYKEDNPNGYKVYVTYCTDKELDSTEQWFIKYYANNGYQMLNKTIGGQGKGKQGIAENRPSKGYHDGLKQGYKNAQKDLQKIFKYFTVTYDTDKKLAQKAYEKLQEFLGEDNV